MCPKEKQFLIKPIIVCQYSASLTGAPSGHTLASVKFTGSGTDTATEEGTITPFDAAIIHDGTNVTDNYAITYEQHRFEEFQKTDGFFFGRVATFR